MGMLYVIKLNSVSVDDQSIIESDMVQDQSTGSYVPNSPKDNDRNVKKIDKVVRLFMLSIEHNSAIP